MENYVIDDILEVFNQKAFPVGVDFIGGKPQKKSLAKWWAGRAIPGSRIGAASFERRYAVKLAALPFKNYGLSLTDQYWLNPQKNGKTLIFSITNSAVRLGRRFLMSRMYRRTEIFICRRIVRPTVCCLKNGCGIK